MKALLEGHLQMSCDCDAPTGLMFSLEEICIYEQYFLSLSLKQHVLTAVCARTGALKIFKTFPRFSQKAACKTCTKCSNNLSVTVLKIK